MATTKSFTDISQSKVLEQILPLESADMYYIAKPDSTNSNMIPSNICIPRKTYLDGQAYGEFCAWSLAALLGVLPRETRLLKLATDDIYYHCDCPKGNVDEWFDNPVDSCYELIIKLNELKVL